MARVARMICRHSFLVIALLTMVFANVANSQQLRPKPKQIEEMKGVEKNAAEILGKAISAVKRKAKVESWIEAEDTAKTAMPWVLFAFVAAAGSVWIGRRSFKAADIYDVWYGTNRLHQIDNTFDNNFGTKVQYGKCRVAIPKGHVFGSIGSSPITRWLQRVTSRTDYKLAIVKLTPLPPSQFARSIGSRLAKYDKDERAVLIFIHGYNVSFSDAAIHAAQIGFDLKVPGVMALYSWPSNANTAAYLKDADAVAASEEYIVEFVTQMSKAASAAKINIIAHSMGNLGLLRALAAGLSDRRLQQLKFGQIFLAAPDIDVNFFRQRAAVYPRCSDRTTLYISAGDRALGLSRLVHANQRTGYSPPVTIVNGIDTVEVTHVDLNRLGHGYYAEAAGVLYDMATLVRNDVPPDKRPRLFSETTTEGEYWVIWP